MSPDEIERIVTDVNEWRSSSASREALLAGFSIDTPARFNMATAAVGRHARGPRRDSAALVDASATPVRTLSFAELDDHSGRFAQYLQSLGVRRGDVVIAYMAQGIEAALTHLAAYKLGAIVAPLSLLYGRDT